MFFALLVVLGTGAAVPTATPGSPLKTIATVKASPTCSAFVSHVNAAITSALDNDDQLSNTVMTLQSKDIGRNVITRNNEIQKLETLGDELYRNYREGEKEVDALRDLAAKTKDPAEKADIKESADALGGALYRQHLMQRDLDGFVAFIQAGDMRRDVITDGSGNAMTFGAPDVGGKGYNGMDGGDPNVVHNWWPSAATALPAGLESMDDDIHLAGNASEDFKGRLPDVMKDELNAGNYISNEADRC